MNNIKRFALLIIITVILINPLLGYAASDPKLSTTWGTESSAPGYTTTDGGIVATRNQGDILTGGFGVYIKLIKYNSFTKEETIVGTPILLYSGGLLDDITEVDGSASGASSSGVGGSVNVCVGRCGPGSEAYNTFGPGGYIIVPSTSVESFYSVAADSGLDFDVSGDNIGATVFEGTLINDNGVWKRNQDTSCTKSSSNVYSAEAISYYKGKHIRYLFEGSVTDSSIKNDIKGKSVDKNGVTIRSSAVNLMEVSLYDYIKKYILGSNPNVYNSDSNLFRSSLEEENDGRGQVTLAKIMSSFKVSSSQFKISELDSYYFSFEPVTREKTSFVENAWSTSQTSTSTSGSPSFRWSCEWGGTTTTSSYSNPGTGASGCKKKTTITIHKTCPPDKNHKYNWSCPDTEEVELPGRWSYAGCASYKYIRTSTLITNHSEKVSVIQPARYGNRSSIISTLLTSIGQEEAKHCIKDKNSTLNTCAGAPDNIKYEYFIGPNLKTALAGTTGDNKYQLYDENKGHGMSSESAKNNAVGVSYWWIPSLASCNNECDTITDRSSDDLLACAENYCDNYIGYDSRANTQKLKAECITGLCNYTYTPVSCDNSNPYKDLMGATVNKQESMCGLMNGSDNTLDDERATATCVDDTGEHIFDQKTYINIACKESTAVGFSNLTGKKLVAGQGINYYVKQNGYRECSVFWDTETWKFAYASYHSQDRIELADGTEISTREQLVRMLNYFNSASTKSFNDAIGIDLIGEDYVSLNGEYTKWKDLDYEKVLNITTDVDEIIDNTEVNSGNYTLVETYRNPTVKSDIVETDNTLGIHRLVRDSYYLNAYLYRNDVSSTYTFSKYCVSKDGKATVKDALATGMCPDEKGFNPEENGKNVYYTSLNATANKDFSKDDYEHKVNTDVTFTENIGEIINSDNCPYEIDGIDYECIIDIKANDGTEVHGNDIYARGGVTASLYIKDKLGPNDLVKSTTLSSKTTYINSEGKVITIDSDSDDKSLSLEIMDNRHGHEEVELVGTIVTEKGKVATCKKTVQLINPNLNCGARCSVEKYNGNDNIYQIKSVGRNTPSKYFSASSVNFSFVRLSADVHMDTQGLYLVRVDKGRTNYYLYGKVEGKMSDGSTCNDVCWIKIPCDGVDCEQENYNCENKFKEADYDGIKNYCERYWDLDINNYSSVEDCKSQCGMEACPENIRDLSEVEGFCSSNYAALGYDSMDNCVSYCYYCPECSSDYIYRQVSNYNPFPNSIDSNTLGFNYPTGNRIIGSNWVGKSSYIKADDEDTTSVTGIHANHQAEYIIELTPDDIEAIRKNTYDYNAETAGNDAYLDYVYMKIDKEEGIDITNKKYYSEFIHNTFKDLFTTIDGEIVR